MRALISLSSKGDSLDPLKNVLERVSFANKILKVSDVFKTQDRTEHLPGFFFSCSAAIETDMTAFEFLQFLMEARGQVEAIINCDLVDFEGEISRTPQLTLPHPEAHLKSFVIIPLSEMSPQWQHPVLKRSAEELAKEAYWTGWGSFFTEGKTLLDF